jgi:hypothetical protein
MQMSDPERAVRKQHRSRLRILRNILMLALMCVPLLIAMVIFSQVYTTSPPELRNSYLALLATLSIFDMPVIITLSLALLIVEGLITQEAAEAWRQFANQTGLTYPKKTGRAFLQRLTSIQIFNRDVGQVSGLYQGHQVSVYAKRAAKYKSWTTYMTLELKQNSGGDLTLTYVHYPDPYALIEAKLTTFNQAFEIQQQPGHFGDSILTSPSLRTRLLRIHQGTTLRIHKSQIKLQQPVQRGGIGGPGISGIEQDIAYLRFLLDLLSDIAKTIEASSPAKA